jgi:hypothetical protein
LLNHACVRGEWIKKWGGWNHLMPELTPEPNSTSGENQKKKVIKRLGVWFSSTVKKNNTKINTNIGCFKSQANTLCDHKVLDKRSSFGVLINFI